MLNAEIWAIRSILSLYSQAFGEQGPVDVVNIGFSRHLYRAFAANSAVS